jgi:hypothetical protein
MADSVEDLVERGCCDVSSHHEDTNSKSQSGEDKCAHSPKPSLDDGQKVYLPQGGVQTTPVLLL